MLAFISQHTLSESLDAYIKTFQDGMRNQKEFLANINQEEIPPEVMEKFVTEVTLDLHNYEALTVILHRLQRTKLGDASPGNAQGDLAVSMAIKVLENDSKERTNEILRDNSHVGDAFRLTLNDPLVIQYSIVIGSLSCCLNH